MSGDFPAVVERVIDALKAKSFGILTEIDVKVTMKKKTDIDFSRLSDTRRMQSFSGAPGADGWW